MSRRRPPAAFLAFAAALSLFGFLATPGGARAIISTTLPHQSLGDRGTDVVAIQYLLRYNRWPAPQPPPPGRSVIGRGLNPLIVPMDGVFGPVTDLGVRAFQASRGLAETGIVDPTTWDALLVPLAQGDTGEPVIALQFELREKRAAPLALDGVFGATTRSAVVLYQSHMGLPQTGAADLTTWKSLIGHFELPRFSAAALCDHSTGNGPANWGTAETIATLETAGAAMVARGLGRVSVNDVSFEHGGFIPGHGTHEVGLDADVRPMGTARNQCTVGILWNRPGYDRAATRALILAVKAATPGHVKTVLFSDPVLIAEGLTVYHAAHDDHIHFRICEHWHPRPLYRC